MQLTITRQLVHLEKNVLANKDKGQKAPQMDFSTPQNNCSEKNQQNQCGNKENQFFKPEISNN